MNEGTFPFDEEHSGTDAELHPTHTDTGGTEMYESDRAIGTDGAVKYYQGVTNKLNHEGDFSGVQLMRKGAPQTEHDWSPLHRPNQWQPLIANDTSVVESSADLIGFNARSVVVHNYAPQFVYLPDARTWVPPGAFNVVLRLPYAVEQARFTFAPLPGFAQPAANVGAGCITLWTEELLEPSPGVLLPGLSVAAVVTGAGAGGASLGAPPAADILDARSHQVAAGTATVLTVPAGRTWVGTVNITVSAGNEPVTATGSVIATLQTAGAGVTPTAGSYFGTSVVLPGTVAGALSGVTGDNSAATTFTVVAPAANAVTLAINTTVTGTVSELDIVCSAVGLLQ